MINNKPRWLERGSGELAAKLHSSTDDYTFIYSENGHRVGKVNKGTLYKTIQGSKHFLRFPPGIAIDLAVLDNAEKAGAGHVQIKDSESGVIFRATISHFRTHGQVIDRGYGVQIVLPFFEFKKIDPYDHKVSQLRLGQI